MLHSPPDAIRDDKCECDGQQVVLADLQAQEPDVSIITLGLLLLLLLLLVLLLLLLCLLLLLWVHCLHLWGFTCGC
jgi:hypothetical protein